MTTPVRNGGDPTQSVSADEDKSRDIASTSAEGGEPDPVAEAMRESFPASDPPSFVGGNDIDAQNQMPDFKLPASTGQTLSRESFLGKVAMVVFFIPDLGRPDSQVQIERFNGLLAEFGRIRCQVLGVANETARSLREYVDVFTINLPILADASGHLARSCRAVDNDGRFQPVSLIIDVNGKIRDRRDDHASPETQEPHSILERAKEFAPDRPNPRADETDTNEKPRA